jgi:HK97 family phage major capsid protein
LGKACRSVVTTPHPRAARCEAPGQMEPPRMSIHQLRAKRAAALDPLNAQRDAEFAKFKALGEKADFDVQKDQPEFDRLKGVLVDLDAKIKAAADPIDAEIKRHQDMLELGRQTAAPIGEQPDASKVYAAVKADYYTHKDVAEARGLTTNKGLVIAGVARSLSNARGGMRDAADWAARNYGEGHPVTKALVAGIGSSGGFIIPPEYINEIIELLRPQAVVRSANPRTMPMPRGTMTLPAQTGAATANYGGESNKIATSQQTLGQIIASYKKLTALVPVSNDMMRYADPAADAFVRDDLVKVMALREDLAFLINDGSAGTPRGFLSFAGEYAVQMGGSLGAYLATANSTMATGGNFITSTANFDLATVASELGGAVNKLDTANVADSRRVWFMHPRAYNYLFNVQNSLGLYVYRDELSKGTLLTYPIKRSTQLPINIWDAAGSNKDLSFVMLVEMTDAMILDSMTLELFVSREGSYTDSGGNQVNLVQADQTLIRAIAEHDFQMRHPASVAVIQGVRWAPAIS